MARDRVTPVKTKEAPQPIQVLQRQRLIESERMLEAQAVGLGEIGVPLVCRERPAGLRLDDREGRDADGKEERHCLQQPADDISPQRDAASYLAAATSSTTNRSRSRCSCPTSWAASPGRLSCARRSVRV